MLSTVPGFNHDKRVKKPLSILTSGGQRFFPGINVIIAAATSHNQSQCYKLYCKDL